MSKRLVIRFDGPPSHESGRFIEVELDGASVSYGEWEQDGDDWLLVLPDADTRTAQLESGLEYLKAWASQPTAGLTERQVMNAVVNICDDVLGGTQ